MPNIICGMIPGYDAGWPQGWDDALYDDEGDDFWLEVIFDLQPEGEVTNRPSPQESRTEALELKRTDRAERRRVAQLDRLLRSRETVKTHVSREAAWQRLKEAGLSVGSLR